MAPMIMKGSLPAETASGQRGVRRLEGQIFLAGEKSQERAALERDVVANRPAKHRIACLECVEDRAHRDRARDVDRNLASDVRQRPQMRRKDDLNHGSVCTSTESTAGRSAAMGAQLSPESDEAYT